MSEPSGELEEQYVLAARNLVQERVDAACARVAELLGVAELAKGPRAVIGKVVTAHPDWDVDQVVGSNTVKFHLAGWQRERPVASSPAPTTVAEVIRVKLGAGPAGDPRVMLGGASPKQAAWMAQIAASAAVTGGDTRVVWSGGASDCVIVGGFNGGKAKMVHLDRTSAPGDFGPVAGWQIYLASEKFTLGEEVAVDGLVKQVITWLMEKGADVRAIYPTKQLAIDVEGTVLANFDPARLTAAMTPEEAALLKGYGSTSK